MKLDWVIEPSEIEKVKAFVESQLNDRFVQNRIQRNLRDEKLVVDMFT